MDKRTLTDCFRGAGNLLKATAPLKRWASSGPCFSPRTCLQNTMRTCSAGNVSYQNIIPDSKISTLPIFHVTVVLREFHFLSWLNFSTFVRVCLVHTFPGQTLAYALLQDRGTSAEMGFTAFGVPQFWFICRLFYRYLHVAPLM